MSNSDDALGDLDATALAALVRKREVSALELVDDAIRRCAQVNDTLNAVVTDMFDRARAEARAPLGDGPFAGVPFLMKDFGAEVAGVRFTEGSAFLENYIPDVDAELYKRFRRAGLITIGKTNLPELAIGVTTESKFLGPACNPWDPTRTTGGSSGGAGAAVAARIVPMAHGNDVGGSIRIPASCCGLVGLKPTRGRTTLAPHYGDLLAGYFVEHALTRSVRDSAMLLDVTHGPAVGDPYVAPPPARPYAEEVGADPGCLKIGFSIATPLGDALDPECVKAVRETAALCESLGHEVIEARPSFDAMALWTEFTTLLAAAVAWAVGGLGAPHRSRAGARAFRSLCVGLLRAWPRIERGRLPACHAGRTSAGACILRIFRRLRFVLDDDAGCAAGAARHPGLRRRSLRVQAAQRALLALYLHHQRNRAAGDIVAAALDARGPACRPAFRRAVWRRGDAHPPRGATRIRQAVERPAAAGVRGVANLCGR